MYQKMAKNDSLSGNVPEDGEEEEDDQVHDEDADDNVQKPGVEGGDEEICSSVTLISGLLQSSWAGQTLAGFVES